MILKCATNLVELTVGPYNDTASNAHEPTIAPNLERLTISSPRDCSVLLDALDAPLLNRLCLGSESWFAVLPRSTIAQFFSQHPATKLLSF